MFEGIQKTIFDVTGKKALTPDTDFILDLELNSFDIINIICRFEEYFDIDIPTRDVWQLRLVSDVIDYLAKRGIDKWTPAIS